MPLERLQKIIAAAGVCSRRQAESLIRQGRVEVDGRTVTALGSKADPGRQKITVDGSAIRPPARVTTILLNKPKGVVTTMRDPQGRPTVAQLIAPAFRQRLFPVGRLDIDTEGALIMTNDGDLAQRLLHPKYEIDRTYLAVVKGNVGQEAIRRLEQGVDIGGHVTAPAAVTAKAAAPGQGKLVITIHEGRKRQVRKMCAAVGHPVVHLKRLAYGGLKLGDLPPGAFRRLGRKDIERLFSKKNLYKHKNAL